MMTAHPSDLSRYLVRYGGYEDALFAQQVVRTVMEHDPTAPYFLFCKNHHIHPRIAPDPTSQQISEIVVAAVGSGQGLRT